jgi:hypothetical protein
MGIANLEGLDCSNHEDCRVDQEDFIAATLEEREMIVLLSRR